MTIPFKVLKDGTRLPSLGLGTWLMGGDATRTDTPQDKIDATAIRDAIDMGFTHIDTAELYGAGHAEEIVADGIKGTDRSQLFIATKVSPAHHTPALLAQSLDASLKRLNIDYLDLYYLHQPSLDIPLEETANALNKAYQSGKIKYVGVCNFAANRLDELQKFLEPKIIANQVHYNLSFREPEKSGLLKHAIDRDYFIVAWRPLRLKRRNADHPAVSYNIWESGVSPVVDAMAEKYNMTNTQIALLWTTYYTNVATIIKSSNAIHLQEAFDSFAETLSADDYHALSEKFEPQFDKSDTIALI